MDFTILGEIKEAEIFATGQGIRDLSRRRKTYGNGRWRKRLKYSIKKKEAK